LGRFYSNENIALPVVLELRRLGHDILTSLDAGNANRSVPDSEVLAFATAQHRILLTHNRRDFLRLHETGGRHAGMVLCTFDPDFISLAHRIHTAVPSSFDAAGQVIRINRTA
jgi:predicted nuclease of predicted toxin-antitoxin system